MSRLKTLTTLAALLSLTLATGEAQATELDPVTLGTSFEWERSPEEAFRAATRDRRLVLLVHLSGNLDREAET